MTEEKRASTEDRYGPLSRMMVNGQRDPRRERRLRIMGLTVVGAWVIIPTLFWAGCEQREPYREFFREPTPHEAYLMALAEVGLTQTALGRDWMAAANGALDNPLTVGSPYREEGFFPPDRPDALGFRFHVERGQRLTVEVELDADGPGRLFLDLYRAAPEGDRFPVPVLSTEVEEEPLEFDPSRAGDYIVRIQPEVLHGGRYTLTIRVGPSLAFPVAGHGMNSIGSFFGDPRDGGRREHHGVDVFARRGTPVLAAADGYVTRVADTNIGGRVVWQRDSRTGNSIYYAHLHRQLVRSGQRVSVGDTIGLVGNTGNARTTPPHLHFGVYQRRRGAVDPWVFIEPTPTEVPQLTADLGLLGRWVRVSDEGIRLRRRPALRGGVMEELPRHTVLRVLGGSGDWFRVRLPDGQGGYVAARLTELAERPVSTEVLAQGGPIRMSPDPAAPIMANLQAGDGVTVLGSFRNYLYVRSPDGHPGWMAAARLLSVNN